MLIEIKKTDFSYDEQKKNFEYDDCADYKIIYLMSGNSTIHVTKGGNYCLSPGNALVLLPYEKCKLVGKSERCYEIIFNTEAISKQIYDDVMKFLVKGRKIDFADRQGVINQIVDRLYNESREEKSHKSIVISALLNRLFVEIIRAAKEKKDIIKSDDQAIARVIEYIDKNYSKKISIEDMMKIACMGSSCFQQKFKMYVGMTPNEYLNKTRISISIKYLSTHSIKNEDLARMVGMKSASYYCSQFKKYMKVTPRQYGKYIDSSLNHFDSRKIIENKDGDGLK